MADRVYLDGVEVPGLNFPYVHAYTASLETEDPLIFDRLFKRFLAESVLATVDGKGGVTMSKDGVTVRIYLTNKENSKKKSEFFQP